MVVPVDNAVAPNVVANIASGHGGFGPRTRSSTVLNGAFLTDPTKGGIPYWNGPLADVIGFSGAYVDPVGDWLPQGTSSLTGPSYEADLDLWARAGGAASSADFVLNALAVATNVYGLYQAEANRIYYDDLNAPQTRWRSGLTWWPARMRTATPSPTTSASLEPAPCGSPTPTAAWLESATCWLPALIWPTRPRLFMTPSC